MTKTNTAETLEPIATEVLNCNVLRMPGGNSQVPTYANEGDACFDLYAAEEALIAPGKVVAVGTGLVFEVPEGHVLKIYPRSGVSLNTALRLANGTGIVDSGFRGEVKVLLWNSAPEKPIYVNHVFGIDSKIIEDGNYGGLIKPPTYVVKKGDRIAQGEIVPVKTVNFISVTKGSVTKRADSGFGSSGK